ncbi:histidine kinase N-terminal 7TM domain-containing protein [Halococcus agarilyticus]|uniref:histidine kinase N-terminal 7TM domain-containing protein n=1 Tax=Halococcus agarilyticus TaxID=1232219 RepID=UPI0006780FA1|nr:histidine kinase N-terminal 7TM domain-containing protein [Halococcus agarilyticus]
MVGSAPVYVTLLAVSAAATVGLGLYAWRRRRAPGARAFAGLMAAMTVWSAAGAATTVSFDPGAHLFWENVQYFGIAFVPVCWLLFATAYTGYDEVVSRRSICLLSALPVATLALVWTNPWHGLVWLDSEVVVVGGIATVQHQLGPWFWVNFLYAYTLIGIASFLLLRLAVVSEYLYADQSVLLGIGTVVPLAGNAVSVFGLLPLPGFDLTPFAFTVTGVAFGYALFRQQLLDLVPATRRIGRDAAIADLDDGVLILDTDRRVVYANAAAAAVLDREPVDVLGEPAKRLVDDTDLDFDAPDGLAELERGDRTYEVRTSPIADHHDREVGHTLVLHDITNRKRRERRLRQQRDELDELDAINTVIREINQALVAATTRDEIEREVCERLVASDSYRAAWAGRGLIDTGESIRWTVAVDDRSGAAADGGAAVTVDPAVAATEGRSETDTPRIVPESIADAPTEQGSWTSIPLLHDRIVYGVVVLCTTRTGAFGERELAVLAELGETIGHAINAVEKEQLLAAETVVELDLACSDRSSFFVDASLRADCTFELDGVVPAAEGTLLAYFSVAGATPEQVRELAADAPGITSMRAINEDADGGLFEFGIVDGSPLVPITSYGAHVRSARVASGQCRLACDVASEADARALLEHLREAFPKTNLLAKRESNRSIETMERFPDDGLDDLTDRQRETLEIAYRAGYFDWPRESTAEEVAASMGIAAPTLHRHLRRAHDKLLAEFFEEHR